MEDSTTKNRSLDLINSLALYKAQEAGVIDEEKISTKLLGICGSVMTDISNTGARYLSKEIKKEEAKQVIKNTVEVATKNIIDVGIDSAAEFVKKRMPILSSIVNIAKEYVKTKAAKIVNKVFEKGEKIWNKIKDFFHFNHIFFCNLSMKIVDLNVYLSRLELTTTSVPILPSVRCILLFFPWSSAMSQ